MNFAALNVSILLPARVAAARHCDARPRGMQALACGIVFIDLALMCSGSWRMRSSRVVPRKLRSKKTIASSRREELYRSQTEAA
jgi:hypothetical protein